MKKRVRAMFLALLMVFSTVFTVVTPTEVKAAGTKTIIIHYNRPDGEYDNWDIWAWPKDAEGTDIPFSYSDDWGKVAVIQKSGEFTDLGFIIRRPDWSEKDVNEDQFITLTGDVTEVWVNAGEPGYLSEAPAGAQPFDLSQLSGNGGGSETPDVQAPAEGEIQVNIHYHRFDNNYDGWNLWLWPDGGEGSGNQFNGEDDYGKIATYNFDASIGKLGFIVRLNEWASKDIDKDRFIDLSKAVDGKLDVYLLQSDANIYFKVEDVDLSPKIISASLTTTKRIALKTTVPVDTEAKESLSLFKVVDQNGKSYEIMNLFSMDNAVTSTFNINMKEPLDLNNTYTIVSEEYTDKAVSYGDVYTTDEFNDAFYYDGNDLGAVYSADSTTFKVWSPFATEIKLNLYKEGLDGEAYEVVTMTKGEKGVWSAKVTGDLNGVYYTYSVTNSGETNEVVDLYARTTGANGKRGMVIDLSKTNPDNWASDLRPQLLRATDTIIYEMHVRDFTIDESSGVTNKGKYLGLIEKGTKNSAGVSTGLDHIVDLGVTHVQLIPVYDYSPNSVDETKLDKPQFNWGYDPYNYNAPEGSYSTDPYNGEVRVNEFKQMVQGFHSSGLRVIMDVVYNHTAESANSWMNLTVPGYYYRINEDGSFSNGSGCGNEVASERSMVRKYIVDSVVYWASEYHLDGFRFDLMALLDMETIQEVRKELNKIDPTIVILGEGWTGGTSLLADSQKALKMNMYQMNGQIAAFSDDIRDGIKGSVFSETDQGFASGKIGQEERIKSGVVGATNYSGIKWSETYTDISKYWANSPMQTINYVSAHDNLTLWDKIAKSNKNDTEEDKIKVNLLSASIVYTAQGIPFMLSGEEMLRSKGGDHNSYKSPDSVNAIKWDDFTNTEVYEYYKGLIQFRKNHAGLRMTTTADVEQYLKFIEAPSNVVAYTISGDAKGEVADNLLIIYNGNKDAKEVTIPDGEWKVCIKGNKAGTDVIETVSGGKVTVEGISTLALVQGETVDATADEVDLEYGFGYVPSAEEPDVPSTPTTPDAEASTEASSSSDDKDGESGSNLPLILGIGAVVVAIIAALVIKSKKSKKANAGNGINTALLGEDVVAPVVESTPVAPVVETPAVESPVAEPSSTDDTTV